MVSMSALLLHGRCVQSAALGLSIAGALALGYSNIFVTAPSPENLKTLFQFVFKVRAPCAHGSHAMSCTSIAVQVAGTVAAVRDSASALRRVRAVWRAQGLDALGYKEHIDYDLVESTNPAFGKAVVRVNVFRAHRQVRCGSPRLLPHACRHACQGNAARSSLHHSRWWLVEVGNGGGTLPCACLRCFLPALQTVQYILPQHHAKLAQAELLVIDEAAAIPLPTVRTGRPAALTLQPSHRQLCAHPCTPAGARTAAGAWRGISAGEAAAGPIPGLPLLHRQRLRGHG